MTATLMKLWYNAMHGADVIADTLGTGLWHWKTDIKGAVLLSSGVQW